SADPCDTAAAVRESSSRLRLRRSDADLLPARGDFPRDEVEKPAAREIGLHPHFDFVRTPPSDVEEIRLIDHRHRLLELAVAAIRQQVFARDGVELRGDFDAGAPDSLIEPVGTRAEDLDDVGDRRRGAAPDLVDAPLVEGRGQIEMDRDAAAVRDRGEVLDLRFLIRRSERRDSEKKKNAEGESPHGVAFLPHSRDLRLGVSGDAGRLEVFILFGGGLQDLLHETRMHRVAGLRGRDLADDRPPDEREITEQVEDLVANELIAEAELAVHDTLIIEHDAVFDRPAARQTGSAKLLDIAHETEGARRCDLLQEVVVIEVELHRLAADDRMVEIDLVLENQPVCRGNSNTFIAIDDLDRLLDPQHRNLGAERTDTGGVDEMHERKRAAVDDRNFGTIDPDVDIGDPARHDRGEKMFDGANRYVVLTDRGRVIESSGRSLESGNAKAVEIRTDESDSASSGSGVQRDFRVDAGVKSDTRDADGCVDGFALSEHDWPATRARGVPFSEKLPIALKINGLAHKGRFVSREKCGAGESRLWRNSHMMGRWDYGTDGTYGTYGWNDCVLTIGPIGPIGPIVPSLPSHMGGTTAFYLWPIRPMGGTTAFCPSVP